MNTYHPKAAITIPQSLLTIELTMEQLLEFCGDESIEAFLKDCTTSPNSLDEVSEDLWFEVINDWFESSYWGFQSENMKKHNIKWMNVECYENTINNATSLKLDDGKKVYPPIAYVTITNEMFLIQPTIEQLLEGCFEPMVDNRVYITDFLQNYPDGSRPYSTLDEIPTDVWEDLLRDYFINVYYSDTNRHPFIRFSDIGDIKVELLNDDVCRMWDTPDDVGICGFCNEETEINHLCPDCLSIYMRWDVPELIRKNS